ncbi:bacillithiol biosynthesis cysteine-adding enzyme BshC [Roseivirga sp.]|uniref:bacillithiol biosynthesis cysteine-adding enzyme BshC n=1 Tax=Roseivirga sp. TaxID=1964215 RepID=UPI003B8D0D49
METTEEIDCLLAKIPFEKTNSFSNFFLDYIKGDEQLSQYHNGLPTAENLLNQIESRNFPSANRAIMAEVLKNQHADSILSDETKKNLDELSAENTYTITTGHQLNIFTGPLYVIYKIVSVIKTCEELKRLRPDCNFVPVYWMASEDHDFEEINHFRYNAKKFSWNTDQTGAVGKFDTSTIKSIFDELPGLPEFFSEAYLKHSDLASSVRHYMNHLFGEYGLVIIDADDRSLKTLFKEVMVGDIIDHSPQQKVEATSSQLNQLGYKTQVNPREINFFYMEGDVRSRIVRTETGFEVLDTDISFSEEEIRMAIDKQPELFSPNVVLRPLYQEYLLPNLAYVGGPSELVYWLQLKDVFEHFNTTFPLLMPRNFAGVISHPKVEKIKKAGLSFEDLFKDESALVKEKVIENTAFKLDLDEQRERLRSIFSEAHVQAIQIDKTLEKLVLAEHRKAEKSIEKIEFKILKAERKNQEVLVNRIYNLKESLFPGGAPQERKDNFLNFYLSNPSFIEDCLKSFDPLDFQFHLISTNE